MQSATHPSPESGGSLDGDALAVEGRQPPSRRTPLSEERIVAAAVAYIDEHGLPGLSMRRLGATLGVEAMALYRYVPSRDDLLDDVVGHLVSELDTDDDVLHAPRDGWQDFLQRLAHGIRRVALAHPQAFPLVASRPPEAPWLRPPLRSLRWVELFLDGLIGEGFSDEAAVAAYRAFSSFLLGHLLLEVVTHGADISPLDRPDADTSADAAAAATAEAEADLLADHPTVRRLHGLLAQNQAVVEFEEALEELLARLAQTKVEL